MPFAGFVLPALILRPGLETALGLVHMNLGPISVTLGFLFNIMMVAIAAALAGYALLVDRRYQAPLATVAMVWSPFLIGNLIAALHSPQPALAMQVLFNSLTYASVSYLAISYAPSIDRATLTKGVALTAVLPLLTGLAQIATGTAGPRLQASFAHPNILAFFLLIVITFLVHALVQGYVRSRPWVLAIAAVLVVGGLELLLTGTRSAYIATYIAIFLYLLWQKPVFILPMFILPFAALMIPAVSDRMQDVLNGSSPVSYDYIVSAMRGDVADSGEILLDSGTWRKYLWKAAWPWIEHRLLLGHGLSSFQFYSRDFFPLAVGEGSGAHNIYVQMMFEGGLLLLLGYLVTYVGVIAMHFRRMTTGAADSYYAILLMMVFAVASFSDNMLYYLSVNIMMWGVVFVLLASKRSESLASSLRTDRPRPFALAGGLNRRP
ncbi:MULTISPECIES: O-antigen ligase family protein [Sphingomonas]|uniref:O-antigen ligase family protein n=1 Tax=Sphingomonas zeae TaxID=1646122 RepID=A0A7Y6B7F0_9SPHN|nr:MULTISPECIES: O-antigen ligase family protein [Sphingomonas]MBB4046700.1 O-antigen ligase [Sphingomonas zeae]MDK8184477.1 O-antigen ligase family protein [Sphingomonas zeae]MDK8214434.1 O-antigen ligase family protein [Sphingomonas sp. UMB7805-LC452B]NUU48809.1 O-antigen ligase family protein [Sphingomonas zeae]